MSKNISAEALEALLACIDKYEAAAQREELPSLGPAHCQLCLLFHPNYVMWYGLLCYGCPVREATEQPFCINTPYGAVERATGSEIAIACAAEAEFLKSLLPPEVQ